MTPDSSSSLASGLSGRDHYARTFEADVEREAELLRRTADEKIRSITRVLRQAGVRPRTVLEVGAGTGAVIGGLAAQGVGEEYYAVDFSPTAVAYVAQAYPTIATACADIAETPDPFGAGPYDVVVASHVVEHLETPGAFLRALRDVDLGHLVVEVPLEDLPLGRLKARWGDRSQHPAGHVQFYDRASARAVVESNGWEIVGDNLYAPYMSVETYRWVHGEASPLRKVHKLATELVLPRLLGPMWSQWYHAHYTMLCRRSA